LQIPARTDVSEVGGYFEAKLSARLKWPFQKWHVNGPDLDLPIVIMIDERGSVKFGLARGWSAA
jgi:hypothetical protein